MQACLLYTEIDCDIKGSKNISIICKHLMKKTSLTKEVAEFLKTAIFSFKFSHENNIAKLAIGMSGNCSNRLCQSIFPTFNTFSICFYFTYFHFKISEYFLTTPRLNRTRNQQTTKLQNSGQLPEERSNIFKNTDQEVFGEKGLMKILEKMTSKQSVLKRGSKR